MTETACHITTMTVYKLSLWLTTMSNLTYHVNKDHTILYSTDLLCFLIKADIISELASKHST